MTSDETGDVARMRISDAERDRAAAVISEAFAQGRLTPAEHSSRLDSVYAARTHGDVVPLVSDLPGGNLALTEGLRPHPIAGHDRVSASKPTRIVSVFSGAEKKGVWDVPAQIDTVSVFGGASLDLREALISTREVKIRAICVFGGMDITVPPEMRVVDSGFSIFGGRHVSSATDEPPQPDAPVLIVQAICVFGGISVTRKRRKNDRDPRELRRGQT